MKADLSVYLITDAAQAESCGRDLVATVRAAVAGGVTAVQVRDKYGRTRDTLALVAQLSEVLPRTVALIVNDRVDVFLAARAAGHRVDGVHLGQHDLPAVTARALIGPDAVLGVSASCLRQITAALDPDASVDYLGLGAVRETSSKEDAPPSLGIGGIVDLAAASPLPCVAIGGVRPRDLPMLRAGGLVGAAVVSWVCASPDPERAAVELSEAWAVAA